MSFTVTDGSEHKREMLIEVFHLAHSQAESRFIDYDDVPYEFRDRMSDEDRQSEEKHREWLGEVIGYIENRLDDWGKLYHPSDNRYVQRLRIEPNDRKLQREITVKVFTLAYDEAIRLLDEPTLRDEEYLTDEEKAAAADQEERDARLHRWIIPFIKETLDALGVTYRPQSSTVPEEEIPF
jgi:hypothetical protein